jgi:hydrogenase/urease accessory protein HupE
MSLVVRWLSLLVVFLLSASAAAHPVLEDALNVTLSANDLQLEVRSTLRPVVVATDAKPAQGSYFSPSEMTALVAAHAAYLQQHLTVRANDQLLTAREAHGDMADALTEPVQEHVDLERLHARFTLKYPLSGALKWLSLEQDMLSDAPGDRSWRLSYIVTVHQVGMATPVATGILTRDRGFDYKLSAADAFGSTDSANVPHDFLGYFLAGIRHILGGWDHLLFVSALVLATRRLTELIKVVLAFTTAHSVTLTLAVLHLVHLPEAVVEPLIALSIVVVSLENLLRPERGAGATRLAVAFGFGLVHGLGFAGPLVDALQGAPPRAIAIGIIGFSLGVELGHQLVVLPLFTLVTSLARTTHDRSWALTLRLGSLATAIGGAFFLVRALQTFVFA